MTTHIGKVTIKVFRVTRGNKREPKETWWWNDGVQNAINEKKNATNVYITTKVMKIYRSTKKPKENAKKAVSKARGNMMSTRWLNFKKGRQKTSTKLNVLRMMLIDFW
jgi:hypothetical protein